MRNPKLIDCFLFNNESELLNIRLQLLAESVDRFVIVWAGETFTGKPKKQPFPWGLPSMLQFADKIDVIVLERLEGRTAWEKEWFSRNSLARGLNGLADDDLVMISDVDELPRPETLLALRQTNFRGMKLLTQDYYNFKFNYQLIHGLQATWAGPIVCPFEDLTSPQQLRNDRWKYLHDPDVAIHDAGWHFSFLTGSTDVDDKLSSFSHQEREVQSRTENVCSLISSRHGFHDHVHPGAIWAVVDFDSYRCPKLRMLIQDLPALFLDMPPDSRDAIQRQVKLVVNRMQLFEREKLLRSCHLDEIHHELWRRLQARIADSAQLIRRRVTGRERSGD